MPKTHLTDWGLYLITDEPSLGDPGLFDRVRALLVEGVGAIQLRAKTMSDNALFPIGAELRRLTRLHGAAFIVNDRPHLALELEADGVHVGQGDMSAHRAREIVGAGRLVGLSTHNRDQIDDARDEPIDYIGVGPVFETQTKQDADPVAGLDLVAWAAEHAPVPIVAIGGIGAGNIDQVLEAGARNVAVISSVWRAPDPTKATADLIFRIQRKGR